MKDKFKAVFPLFEIAQVLGFHPKREDEYYYERLKEGCRFLVIGDAGGSVRMEWRRFISTVKTWESAKKTYEGWLSSRPLIVHVSQENVCTVLMACGYLDDETRKEIQRNLYKAAKAGIANLSKEAFEALQDEVDPPPATVYLAGPINGCTDEECKDWREAAKKVLPNTIDPMVRDYRGREDECFAEIVEGDMADIQKCGVLLVNYVKPSVGTSMEIFYARTLRKPVIVVAAPGTVISPWLRYHSTAIVPTFAEAFELCLKERRKKRGW